MPSVRYAVDVSEAQVKNMVLTMHCPDYDIVCEMLVVLSCPQGHTDVTKSSQKLAPSHPFIA